MNINQDSFVTIDYLINLGEGRAIPRWEGRRDLFLHGRGRCLRVWKKL